MPSRSARLIIGLLLSASLGLSQAGASVYEPFNYSTGAFADGTPSTGSGYTGNWTCGSSGTIVPGLSYTDLPTDDNALESSFARQYVSLTTPLSGGSGTTNWITFLYKTSPEDPGGNDNGVFFPNGNTDCLFFGFGLQPQTGTQGQLGLGSMTTAGSSATGATTLQTVGLGTYGDTYLVALEIVFDTSASFDTVTVYLNPVPNQDTPGVPAAGSYSGFDVGTITGVGLNVTGAGSITVDEIRVGDTYEDAIGALSDPPAVPTGLVATPGTNHVSLSWSAAAGSPASYNVKRSSSSGGPYSTIGSTAVPTVTFEEDIIGGQVYYYVVSAVNTVGESSNSVYAAVTPILAAPDAPTGLAATPGDSIVSLSWTGSDFATGYTVKRAEDIAGPYTTIDTTTAPTVTYDDTFVTNAVTYYYAVAATGAGGSSTDTAPVDATPFGPLPFVLNIDPGLGVVWYASNSVTYQVQWAETDLGTNTVWNNLGAPIAGNGETNTVFDPVGEPHNYYRVLSIQ